MSSTTSGQHVSLFVPLCFLSLQYIDLPIVKLPLDRKGTKEPTAIYDSDLSGLKFYLRGKADSIADILGNEFTPFGWDSSVGKATRYGLDGQRIESR